jgi:hypothetical protein
MSHTHWPWHERPATERSGAEPGEAGNSLRGAQRRSTEGCKARFRLVIWVWNEGFNSPLGIPVSQRRDTLMYAAFMIFGFLGLIALAFAVNFA